MPVAALILVEPSQAGNLGAIMRVAANFGVTDLELVRPRVEPADPEVVRWARNADQRLAIRHHETLKAAAAAYRTVVGTSSGRGRNHLTVVGPRQLVAEVARRGPDSTALVLGNETRGLRREELDRCDLVVHVPTRPEYPVLNVAQAAAILLGHLAIELDLAPAQGPAPALRGEVDELFAHLQTSLLSIGFLDPANPDRVLCKLRRLLGRAGVSDNEVAILRGICRQVDWAARQLR